MENDILSRYPHLIIINSNVVMDASGTGSLTIRSEKMTDEERELFRLWHILPEVDRAQLLELLYQAEKAIADKKGIEAHGA
nr:MAG TPA: hypothetical protein [Caudoviricetes sp.]